MATDILARRVYTRPEPLADMVTHYCPGCTHGIATG
jgi:hypothetical protein